MTPSASHTRRDLICAGALAAGLHLGVLMAIAAGSLREPTPEVPATGETVVIIDTQPPELEPEAAPPEPEQQQQEAAAFEPEVARLPEPPNRLQTDSGPTDRIRPSPPVPARPDLNAWRGVPTTAGGSGQGQGRGLPGIDVFQTKDLDRPPSPRSRVPPVYPFELRRAGITGSAVIAALLDPQGRVLEVSVVSATETAFGEAAAKAVQQWRFEPARRFGKPVHAWVSAPISFRLSE